MNTNTGPFSYPNLSFDDQEYATTINTPQPLSHRNILFVNCDASELGLSTAVEDPTKIDGKVVRIFVGPLVDSQQPAGLFNRAADAMGIPENERDAHARYISTVTSFQPLSIILLNHVLRTPRVDSTEMIEIHLNAGFAMKLDKIYFLLLAVYSPFAPPTLRKLKVYLEGETLVADLPNGPWFHPSSITTELEVAADYCSPILPAYEGQAISSLAIKEPITPTMLRYSYTAHLNAVLKTLDENARWITHLEISLAFSESLFTIIDACASLKYLTSLTIAECDPSFDQTFNPDNDYKSTVCFKLQPLIGLTRLTIPDKLRSEYMTHWYPRLHVEHESDFDTQVQSMRAFYKATN